VTAVQSSFELQNDASATSSGDAHAQADLMVEGERNEAPCLEIDFVGALLSLRGDRPVSQPLKDTAGNVLVYNGAFRVLFLLKFRVYVQRRLLFWWFVVMMLVRGLSN